MMPILVPSVSSNPRVTPPERLSPLPRKPIRQGRYIDESKGRQKLVYCSCGKYGSGRIIPYYIITPCVAQGR